MVHTMPPWSSKYRMITVFGQIDTGELAARLGSINTFHRSGNTVFQDNFEASLLKWEVLPLGSSGAGVLSSTRARNGEQAVKLTAGSGAEKYAAIYNYWAVPHDTKIGFESSFTTHADLDRIMLEINIYNGSTFYTATAAVSITEDVIYIIKKGGAPETISSALNLYNYDYCFHTLKVVFDYETGYYTRVMFDEQVFDASAFEIESEPSTVAHRMVFIVWAINSKAGNPIIYVDDCIVTQNEP